MLKQIFLAFLVLECASILTFARNSESKSVPGLVTETYKELNQVRDGAEKDALKIVTEIENMELFGRTGANITSLVDGIFSITNHILDQAEAGTAQLVTALNDKLNQTVEKRNFQETLNSLANQSVHLGAKIGNLTNKAELSDKVNNLFDRVNGIVNKISDKIQDSFSKSIENLGDNDENEVNSKKRSASKINNVSNEPELTTIANTESTTSIPVVTTTSTPIVTIAESTTSVPVTSTTTTVKTTTSKYQKMAAYYKKKYASMYMMPEDDEARKKRSLTDGLVTKSVNLTVLATKSGAQFVKDLEDFIIKTMQTSLKSKSESEE